MAKERKADAIYHDQEGQEDLLERVEIDMKQKEIKNLDESAKTIILFKPEVDNKIADLCFFI